ncbi:tryptophan synthase subunit alpha [Candidatus Aerophobetes bacterium]|nr:tryptophan synthase subunit alpha [Candidatus Aerophobetes bacterium]
MSNIKATFDVLQKRGEKAFIPFLTLGYPDMKTCMDLILELEKRGADIIELGIPFSDPLADGPVIQNASYEALRGGVTLKKAIKFVSKLREKTSIPLIFMGYYNPVFKFGQERFVQQAKDAGVDGLILADLPPEEGEDIRQMAKEKDLALIFLLTPVSSEARIKLISSISEGFIYCVSYTGITGGGEEKQTMLTSLLHKIKSCSKTPVVIGFGISSPSQAKKASRLADGVIVGSAIIRKIMENKGKDDMVNKVGDFALSLCQAVK